MSAVPIVRTVYWVVHGLWELGVFSWLQSNSAAQEAPQLTVRRLQVIHTPQGQAAGVTEDVRVTTHDFVNLTDGAPDDTWTEADFLAVETPMDAMWSSLSNHQGNTKVTEYRWYRMIPGEPRVGPPVRIVTKNIPTSPVSTNQMPPQIAITVTEKTALRKHWGRFYIPNVRTTGGTTVGRINTSTCQAIRTAVQTCYQAIVNHANQIRPVVVSHSKRSALTIGEVQVDDVYDVQRRRRYEVTGERQVGALVQPS